MLANRRSSERRACRNFAKIQFATGGLPRDCMISDMSDGGVKIIAEYPGNSFRIHGDFLGGQAASVPAGLADRLRARRAIPRLNRSAPRLSRSRPGCRRGRDRGQGALKGHLLPKRGPV